MACRLWTLWLCLLLPGALGAAAPENEEIELDTLRPNQWVKVLDEKQGGTIGGLVYVPALKGALLYGYPAKATTHEVDLFVTGELGWRGQVPKGPHRGRGKTVTVWKNGRPMLPRINREYWVAGQACYVPTVQKVLYFAGGSTFYYDPAAKAWGNLKIPLHEAPPDVMLGSMAWDPAKKRVILFGGGYLSAYKRRKDDAGRLGEPWTPGKWWGEVQRATWAFDPAQGSWSKVVTGSETFRKHFGELKALDPKTVDLLGAVRGIALEYGDLVSGRSAGELARAVGTFADEVNALSGPLKAGGGCDDGYEAGRCKAAATQLAPAAETLKEASAALAADDGWKAWRALKDARWTLFEAAELLAPSPLPRYYGGFVTDTKNDLLVLFAGHGGNKALADTWIFDGAKGQWRRSGSEAHPGFQRRPTMSFDRKAGLVLLRPNWVYDAAKDDWRTIKTTTRPPTTRRERFWRGWQSLVYDPEHDVHVGITCAHSTFGRYGDRRTVVFRLDASQAKTPKPGGRTWKWMNPKYEEAWSKLPKNDAEYERMKAKQKAFLDGLPTNKWVKLTAPYNCQNRGYGSFCYDPDRDQVVNWGGGHSAYMGNEFSHYDVKSNRWIESWAPDLPPWPFGAPDGDGWNPAMYHRKGSAHGYSHYQYNRDLRKVAFYGGALFYDPDRMRWTDLRLRRVGKGSTGYTVDMSGGKGLYTASKRYYRGGPFGVWKADFDKMTLNRMPGSDPPFGGNDRCKVVFDPTRDRLLWYGVKDKSSGRTCNQLYAFPVDDGKWRKLTPKIEPAGATAPPQMKAWGNCYSAKHDVMVILPGGKNQNTWVYDCKVNVLRKAFPGPKTRQGTCGAIYSAAHDAFIAVEEGSYGVGPVSLHFLRYKPR